MNVAKDGTNRGGPRVGAGRKARPLADKIAEGRTGMVIALPTPPSLEGVEVPPPKQYLRSTQKNGRGVSAEEIYYETWQWLKARGCEKLINPQLIEQYAMSVSRWVQCEEAISEYGFLAQHPTTGNPIASPYVAMSQQYMKQVNQAWFQIYQVVRENCAVKYGGKTPQDDVMEKLLAAGSGEK